MKLFSIKDKGIGYNRVFTANNNYEALRLFSDSVNRKMDGNVLNEHPGDFSLWELGTLDQDSGQITPECKFLEEAVSVKADK